MLLFGAAVLASARPSGWWWSSAAPDPPEDIMLCVGEPVTDPVTGEFLTYFAGQARTYGTQRIGLTSPNRRVIPMTRDYQYVAGKLGDLAKLSQDRADDAGVDTASFSPAVSYVDYAPSVEDILALCMTGFPSFDSKSSHRRSLIYLGPGPDRDKPERPGASLLTAEQVSDMASDAGIQINALSPSSRNAGDLPSIARIVWWPILLTRRPRRTSSPATWTPSGTAHRRRPPRPKSPPLLVRRCARRPAWRSPW